MNNNVSSELDFLTQETMRISEESSTEALAREFLLASYAQEEVETKEFPASSGILFYIKKSGTTFTLKGIATELICDTAETVLAGDKALMRALRIDESDFDKLDFFVCDSREQAEIIMDQAFNKRFPLEEDILCNVSDPGFSWWYSKTDDGFRINFKSHKLEDSGERMKLGPIGDVMVATIRLNQLKDHFKFHMPIREIIINEKQFILKSSDCTHPILKELMDIFETGEISEESALLCELTDSLKLYLKEIAATRKFWLQVETQMAQNPNILN